MSSDYSGASLLGSVAMTAVTFSVMCMQRASNGHSGIELRSCAASAVHPPSGATVLTVMFPVSVVEFAMLRGFDNTGVWRWC